MNIPIFVAPQVWFGSAQHTWIPTSMDIFTHVINCDTKTDSSGPLAQVKTFLHLPSNDDPEFAILEKHFATLCAFVDTAMIDPDAKIYIHCHAGINRSAALAVAYSCRHYGLPAAQVINDIRQKYRRYILTNEGFERQLLARFG
jgi:protein-tyrosine phosphatase